MSPTSKRRENDRRDYNGKKPKKVYRRPRIVYREPIEAVAALCGLPPAKVNVVACSTGPIKS
jgi:hypothetical protein